MQDSKFHPNIFKFLRYCCFSILCCSFAAVHADDIEIYTSVDATGNGSDTASHNILFVLDTSGSMADLTTTVFNGGDYDPDTTYGDGSSDGRVFIYDTDLIFTDESFASSLSVCDGMNTLHASNSSFPVYADSVAQWQQTTDTVTVPGECSIQPGAGEELSLSGSFSRSFFRRTLSQTIPGNSSFTLTLTNTREIHDVEVRTRNPFTGSSTLRCRADRLPSGNTGSCTVNSSASETQLQVRFFYYIRGSNTVVTATGTLESDSVEVCEPDTDQPVATNDWRNTIVDSNDASSVIECALDAGSHGLTEGSPDDYARDCPFGTVCNAPNYNSSSSGRLNFSRANELYVPANFHDFLQNGGDALDPADFPSENASTFCASRSNVDKTFRDNNSGVLFVCQQKLAVMQTAINGLIESLATAPINIGLERFNTNNQGGTIINAIGSIADNATDFQAALNGLIADEGTPLQEAMWEGYRYYRGLSREHGLASTTDPSAVNGDNYVSPITESCQSNNIILLSDGEPSVDEDNRAAIQTLSGETCGESDGACLNELTSAMNRLDLSPDNVSGTNSVTSYTIGFDLDIDILEEAAFDGGGEYFIASDTRELQLAFQNIVLDILSDSSTFVAPAVSVNAFNELQHRNEIYYALFQPAGTPRWPGNVKRYSIDSDGNILDSNNTEAVEAATGFFKETSQSIWSDEVDGRNVTLGGVTEQFTTTRTVFTTNDSGTLIQLDPSNNFSDVSTASLDASSDGQRDQILSWLTGIDVFDDDRDNNLTEANQFLADPLHSRPFVITYGGSAESPEDVLFFTTNLGTLHAVDPNAANGTELWSYLVDEHKDNLLSYIRAPNELTHVYGLDGDLTVVTSEAAGSNSSNFSLASVQLYFGERRGGSRYYAVDASNARRDATPSAILDNSYSTPFKSLWKITGAVKDGDATNNGIDLTDDAALAALEAAIVSPIAADAGFTDLGQTWSRLLPTKLKHLNGTTIEETDVLIFSGGYDPRHDNISYQGSLSKPDYGNAIYIVNAETGQLLYSIGNNNDTRVADQHALDVNMISSIPAPPTIVDIDGDGNVDMLFAIDVTGHVWRVDFNQNRSLTGTGAAAYATGGLIADLSESTVVTVVDENDVSSDRLAVRRFYNALDASRSNAASGSDHINLVVGSGYRSHPSDNELIRNRLYILFDTFTSARSLDSEDEDDRYAYFEDETVLVANDGTIPDDRFRVVTANDLGESSFDDGDANTTDDVKSIFNSPNGIFISFDDNGEKILQRSITFNGVVVVSSFNPDGGGTAGGCGGTLGGGRVYVLDINTGLSVLREQDENGDPVVDRNGKEVIADFFELQHQGIPAETTTLLLPELKICIGTECNLEPVQEALLNGFETGEAYRTFWREN